MSIKRKYPVGIQSFEKLRKDGYLYVDKTPLIYKMITEGCPYFLSRPRRFGKSLLVSTLAAVFEGRRDLFEAFTTEDGIEQPQLFIAQTDWKWEKRPVLRFDFSKDLQDIDELDRYINDLLSDYEHQYCITPQDSAPVLRLPKIVKEAHKQTGKRAVVLVDEYDKMMLHSIGDAQMEKDVRNRFKGLFSPLKDLDDHLQFVFITGISKFSQMGVFSSLNQLDNVSMKTDYECICGISEEELTTTMRPDIELLAAKRGECFEDTLLELKRMYDGYHFSKGMADIYNPFSIINAFRSGDLLDYWFESGTPGAVIEMLRKMPPIQLTDIDGVSFRAEAFNIAFESYSLPLPVLYQSGYLTLKDYRRDRNLYTLGFPNAEVRMGFANCLYQIVSNTQSDDKGRNLLLESYYDFKDSADLPAFIEAIKAFFASLPCQWERDNKNEHYYHSLLYTLLVAFGADVRAEEPTAKGQSDLVLLMPKGIYVMEIKYNDTAEAALTQIDRKGYAEKYRLDGRPVTKVGISFSSEERNITEWKTTN